jgi:hypothetical protein
MIDPFTEMMNERMRNLEDAIQRAEAGYADEDDWNIIRYECGMPRRNFINFETVTFGASNEFSSESKRK